MVFDAPLRGAGSKTGMRDGVGPLTDGVRRKIKKSAKIRFIRGNP
jgi:hypothetical protein